MWHFTINFSDGKTCFISPLVWVFLTLKTKTPAGHIYIYIFYNFYNRLKLKKESYKIIFKVSFFSRHLIASDLPILTPGLPSTVQCDTDITLWWLGPIKSGLVLIAVDKRDSRRRLRSGLLPGYNGGARHAVFKVKFLPLGYQTLGRGPTLSNPISNRQHRNKSWVCR